MPRSSTRACRMKSPVMRFQTNWNSSFCAHMFTPPAERAYSCDAGVVRGRASDLGRADVAVSIELADGAPWPRPRRAPTTTMAAAAKESRANERRYVEANVTSGADPSRKSRFLVRRGASPSPQLGRARGAAPPRLPQAIGSRKRACPTSGGTMDQSVRCQRSASEQPCHIGHPLRCGGEQQEGVGSGARLPEASRT